MFKPFWKITNVLLSLAGFLIVGGMALNVGEELIWVVSKAVGAFVICWIAFNYMGAMLFAILDNKEEPKKLDVSEKEPSGENRG